MNCKCKLCGRVVNNPEYRYSKEENGIEIYACYPTCTESQYS